MATTPVESTSAFQELATALMKSADTNRDGNLSSIEFTDFLSRLLSDLGGGSPSFTTTTPSTPSPLSSTTSYVGSRSLPGWDDAKLADPNHQTVKYKFGRVALNYDASSAQGKEGAEALLNRMRPDLEAAGITVLEITGDKIRVLDDAGQEALIDVIQGSSGPSPEFQWIDTRF